MLPRGSPLTPCSWLIYCVIGGKDSLLLCLLSVEESEVASSYRDSLQPAKLNTTPEGSPVFFRKEMWVFDGELTWEVWSSSHSGYAGNQICNSESDSDINPRAGEEHLRLTQFKTPGVGLWANRS